MPGKGWDVSLGTLTSLPKIFCWLRRDSCPNAEKLPSVWAAHTTFHIGSRDSQRQMQEERDKPGGSSHGAFLENPQLVSSHWLGDQPGPARFSPAAAASAFPGHPSAYRAGQKSPPRSSCEGSAEMNLTSIHEDEVRSLALLGGLRIQHCREL